MSDTAPGPFARFPYAAALFSAACVGMAGWLWMEFSYAWTFTPREMSAVPWKFDVDDPWRTQHPFVGRYVRIVGTSGDIWTHPEGPSYLLVHDQSNEGYTMRVCMPQGRSCRKVVANSFVGRPVLRDECCGCGRGLFVALDSAASRFTGQSVAGLVVGAMGVFIFALHLRRWLVERRRRTQSE